MKNTLCLSIGVSLFGFFLWIFFKDIVELPFMAERRFKSILPLMGLAALPNFFMSLLIGGVVQLVVRNASIKDLIAGAIVLVSAQLIYSLVTVIYLVYDLTAYMVISAPYAGSLLGYAVGTGTVRAVISSLKH
jgi:hypothetical protein